MAKLEQQIQIILETELQKQLKDIPVAKLKKALGEEMLDIIRDRTHRRKTPTSGKMKGYSQRYDKKGSYQSATRKYGKTKYASNSKADMLQLTGNLFSSFNYKAKTKKSGYELQMEFELYIKGATEKKKAGWIEKRRPFFGLATSGSEVKREKLRLQKVAMEFVKKYTHLKIKTR